MRQTDHRSSPTASTAASSRGLPQPRARSTRCSPGSTGRSAGGCCSGPAPGACGWRGRGGSWPLVAVAAARLDRDARRRAASTTTSSMPISTGRSRAPRRARWRAAGSASRRRGPGCWRCARSAWSCCCSCAGRRKLVALGSLALVAAYPFMKRITWWPQAWLGLVFTWGALVGWMRAARRPPRGAWLALYAGAFFWCIGYDTIYALQDREDDALVGIRSSALRLGQQRAGRGDRASTAPRWRCGAWPSGCCASTGSALLALAAGGGAPAVAGPDARSRQRRQRA